MKNSKNDVENFNNLVFEKRNKNYGAFAIRQSYNGTAIKSTLITAGAFLTLLFVLALLAGGETITNDNDAMASSEQLLLSKTDVDNTPKETPKDKPAASAAARASGNFIPSNALAVDTTIKFDANATVVGISKDPNAIGTGTKDTTTTEGITAVVKPEPKKEPVIWTPKMPAFKGDIYKFITQNINFPTTLLEIGGSGTVYVQFIVNEDGGISNVKIAKGMGMGCDEEAMKVVKKMPNWEPGRTADGEAVKVIFNLPIKFKAN
ncbi:MAG: TonB family protein [Bacteroidia bacterium]|nr:TonB family protein [Bacteroidia bacterium]